MTTNDADAIAVVDSPADVAVVYDTLLAPNFPSRELITAEQLQESVASGRGSVRIAGDPATPLAAALVERIEGTPAVLLTYFATRADLRGRGVGSALLRRLLDDIAADDSISVVLGEVEHPGHHESSAEHGDPTARLRFYGRLGGRILDVPYFQPPIAEGEDAVYAMLLLALNPPERLVRDGRLIPEAGVAGGLEQLMSRVDADRFPVGPVLDAVRDPLGIRLYEAAEWEAVVVSRPFPA